MKHILNLLVLSLAIYSCSDANSQSGEALTPEKINEHFFDLYDSKGPSEALEFVFSTNDWINETQTSELKNKLVELTKQLGNYQGKEVISKRSVGENLLLYTFLIKYDRQPIRYLFIYYKPNNKWQLQKFQYDDNLETELIEAASAYRLTENLPCNE
ncbi:hypothetical protein A3SI_19922 [Nitritalea halalkaliphila LW7]|uniref:DUF4878 domain-containing protein n=1 Tax=Nitritalea halalkaliphila LW7 TaxID=1189621 RepID=I5BRT6_9BACT|nr:hypothetical protein [Nitritalea halalkaliphila]EIM72288.1 hypothetical protein A3SI_19922 [Nitritalea halalkaliphila LW7]